MNHPEKVREFKSALHAFGAYLHLNLTVVKRCLIPIRSQKKKKKKKYFGSMCKRRLKSKVRSANYKCVFFVCFTGSFFFFLRTAEASAQTSKVSPVFRQKTHRWIDVRIPQTFSKTADYVSRFCSRSPRSLISRLQTNVLGGRQQLGWHLCSTSCCFFSVFFMLILEWSYAPAPASLTGILEEKKKKKQKTKHLLKYLEILKRSYA